MYWIYDLPNWLVALLVLGASVGLAWLGSWVARKGMWHWLGMEDAKDAMSMALSASGATFGLILGLVIFAVYDNYSQTDAVVDREAGQLTALYQDATGYPEPYASRFAGHLREYTRGVIEQSWPLQRQGLIPETAGDKLEEFRKDLLTFQPANEGQEALHAETLRVFASYADTRQSRLHAVTQHMPIALWWVLLFGAIANIALICLLPIQNLGMHMLVGAVFAGFIGMMIFVVTMLDNPFRGQVSIEPEAFELLYRSVMRR